MTLIARRPHETPLAAAIDVRCSAGLPRNDEHDGRCQLFAGHDGPHAVMFAQAGERMVRTWRRRDRTSTVGDAATMPNRPWTYGCPAPAWFETDAEKPVDRPEP